MPGTAPGIPVLIFPGMTFWVRPGTLLNSSLEVPPTCWGCTPCFPTVPAVFFAVVDDLVTSVALCHGFTALPELHLSSASTTPSVIASRCMIWLPATLWEDIPRYLRRVVAAVSDDPNELGFAVRAELITGCLSVAAPLTRISGPLRHCSSLPRSLTSRR